MRECSKTLLLEFQKYYLRTQDNNFSPDQYEFIPDCEFAISELRYLNVLEREEFIDGSISFTSKYLEKLHSPNR